MNNVKVFVLMAGLTALVVALGQVFGGTNGAVIAFGLSALMNLGMLWGSSKLVLKSYGARVVTERRGPELYAWWTGCASAPGCQCHVVAIAPHEQPNAFATGRNPENSVVCVTEGLMRIISREELEGVIAHELAHIKNRDMLLQTMAATMAGRDQQPRAVRDVLRRARRRGRAQPDRRDRAHDRGPIAAMIMQFAISRQREFKADAVGAEICGRPLALAGALQKLEMSARRIPMQVSPAVAPLAIVNPLTALKGLGIGKLFSTHPPTAERVAKLEALAARMG
jgi:heat shock protein HtpX